MTEPATTDTSAINTSLTALLGHIARYRLTVFPAVERLPEFRNWRPADIKQSLRELKRQDLATSAPLHGRMQYWHLTPGGAQHCGLTETRSGPLSETAKIRAYALLNFCCLLDRPRHRLSTEEIERICSGWHRPGLPTGYYFDPTDKGRVGLARIDAGHRGRWDRILETVRSDIEAHARRSGFRRLASAGRFEITVLTVFRQKAHRLTAALARHRDARRVAVQVVAIPELMPLITSLT